MNRQKGVMIGVGALLGAACVGIGVFFVMVLLKSQEAKGNRDTAFQDLQKFYKAKIFPNDANIAQIKEDQQTLAVWFEAVSNQLVKSAIPQTQTTREQFGLRLDGDIRAMVAQSSPQGRSARVAADFRFGFDKYKGGELPETDDVPRLNQQLDIIKLLVTELNEAGVLKLEKVEREVFEGGESPAAESGGGGGRIRNKPSASGSAASGGVQSVVMSPALANLFDCQRFTVVFHADPDVFVNVLNRLSAMDLLVAVSDMEVKKTGDSVPRLNLAKRETTAKPGEKAVDPAAPVNRVVTNPELEPPISVRLSLDVYSFKGV